MPGRAVGRKVRDAHEARELLGAWSRSGDAMSDWCGRRGINWYSLSAYQGWQVRGGEANRLDGFVEIEPAAIAPAGRRTEARYRVVVGAHIVEVTGDFEEEHLRRLLCVVASC